MDTPSSKQSIIWQFIATLAIPILLWSALVLIVSSYLSLNDQIVGKLNMYLFTPITIIVLPGVLAYFSKKYHSMFNKTQFFVTSIAIVVCLKLLVSLPALILLVDNKNMILGILIEFVIFVLLFAGWSRLMYKSSVA